LLVEFDDAFGRSTDDTVFAAQARAGVNVAITDTLSATVDYTYLRGFDLSEPYCCGAVNDDYEAQTVIAGLRYTFLAPSAPPPAPIIEPVAATSFIIFFDWDSAVLSSEANLVLDDVVVVVNQTGTASLLLDGYTDLSGSAEYNLGLSERRAQSAADGLIARGIAPDEIVIRAFGEENPLVPTPNGVREPQNRRVEIILS
jgi:outer membrane protein OmpA-like peptidoglycan-associated protein